MAWDVLLNLRPISADRFSQSAIWADGSEQTTYTFFVTKEAYEAWNNWVAVEALKHNPTNLTGVLTAFLKQKSFQGATPSAVANAVLDLDEMKAILGNTK